MCQLLEANVRVREQAGQCHAPEKESIPVNV